jgi:hypothetical protein
MLSILSGMNRVQVVHWPIISAVAVPQIVGHWLKATIRDLNGSTHSQNFGEGSLHGMETAFA